MVDLEPPTKKTKSNTKRFQQQWYDDNPSWKKWLQNIPNEPTKFRCLYCQIELSGGLSEIKKHEKTLKHRFYTKLEEKHRKQPKYERCAETKPRIHSTKPESAASSSGNDYDINDGCDDNLDFNQRVKKAEIIIATMAASLNMPFSIIKDVVKTFQFIGKDPDVLQAICLSQTKLAAIINNVICPRETSKVQEAIKNNKFSVYIETSDNTNEKWLSIMVRYAHPVTLVMQHEFLEFLPLDGSDCPASKLFNAFKMSLDRKDVPLENIVGVVCDNAAIMTGDDASFKSFILEINKKIKVFPCVCHSLALLSHDSVQSSIPMDMNSVMSSIACYINSSPKITAKFKEFQFAFNEQPLRLLRHSDTRWLSRFRCMDKILTDWDKLVTFFKNKNVNKIKNSGSLVNNMDNVSVKAYFYFLHFVLSQVNRWNETFQTRETFIQNLQPLCREILIWIVSKFLKESILKVYQFESFRNLDLSDPSNHLPLHEIDVGPKCEDYLKIHESSSSDSFDSNLIRQDCLKFYICAAEGVIKSLPFDDPLLSSLTVFKFDEALNNNDRESTFKKVAYAADELGFAGDMSELRDEWNELVNFKAKLKSAYSKLSFDDLWIQIGLFARDGKIAFPNLRTLVNVIRCLPHSNAEAELAFSIITDVKNKKRTRLSNETLNSLCLIKWNLKVNNINAINYKVTKGHLLLMNSDNLYKKKKLDLTTCPDLDD